MNADFIIPQPNFKFSELIERKAKDFAGYRLRGVNYDVKKNH